jgi:tagaturonate reductase
MEDSYTGKFIREAIFDEIIPTLDLPLDELRAFAEATLERFQNPFIRHELKSIALNSVSKFKVRVLPTILEYNRRMGKLPPRLIFSFAALIRFYKGTWKGEDLPLNDSEEVISFFEEAWTSKDSMRVVGLVLSNQSLWGMDLTTVDRLQEQITKDLDKLEEKGVY